MSFNSIEVVIPGMPMQKFIKNIVPISIVIAAIIIGGGLIYTQKIGKKEASQGSLLSSEQASQKAIDYIDKNLTQGGAQIDLVSASEENGLYKIRLKINEDEFDAYATKNGKLLFIQAFNLDKPLVEETLETESTIGEFVVSENEICKEGEKPIVYFFGTKTCPHCQWEHPVVENVAKKFEGEISFHNNMDSDADKDIFAKYSDGGVPTIVVGCKYFRVGSGESLGETEETKVLTALICKLTENKPTDTCNEVQDLIGQI